MDGLSAAASLISVIELSARITSLCLQYSAAVKDAKKDIEHFQRKVADLRGVLGEVKRLLSTHDIRRLPTAHKLEESLLDCSQRLAKLEARLLPGSTRKTMSRLGVRALKWPFTSKEVHAIVDDLGRYEHTFNLALQVDQTGLLLDLDQKIDFAKLPIAKGASFDSHMNEHNARCLENTRVELQHYIAEWAKNKYGNLIFWLNGMAGTGKSTIARTVAQSFANKDQLGASFFFKKGEGNRGNAARFFTTITTDLISCIPALKMGVRKAIYNDPRISEKTLKIQFEKLILQPLLEIKQASLLPTSGLVIVIDALDECGEEKDIQTILQQLARFQEIQSVSMKVFLTSRPELDIRSSFKQLSEGMYQNLILQDATEKSIEHDIALFLKDQFTNIQAQRGFSPDWPSKDQIHALTEMAIPLFIFAATVCRWIGERRANPKRRLNEIIQPANQISKLGGIYGPILNQLFDDKETDKEKRIEEFQEIVGGIVIMRSPLSITSLGHLFDILKEDISCQLELLHSVLDIPTDEKKPIRLLHLSFRDFLLDPQKQEERSFWIDERKTHENLARKCLQLMSNGHKGLRKNMCNLPRPGTLISEIDNLTIDECLQPEVRYACCYWVYHLQQSKTLICDDDSYSKVYDFLQNYFLYWLEAMSLMQESSESIRMIDSLQLLIDTDKGIKTADFLRDAKIFALQNRSILENAPLQLYSSALIFAPETSIVQNKFKDHIPKWATRLSRIDSSWKKSLQMLGSHPNEFRAIAISPDGQLIAFESIDYTVRLWDLTTGSCHSTLEGHSDWIKTVGFSPDGRLIASGSHDKTVRLWDVTTGLCRSILHGHTDKVKAAVFSQDGQLIASGSGDKTIRLWDVTTGSCHSILKGHSDEISAVVVSRNNQLVASGSDDRTVRLWDLITGSCHSILKGHLDCVRAVCFSPDGQLLASGSCDKTVRLWDVTTGSCHSTLEGHSDSIMAVGFSLDGQLLASGSWDTMVRLWDVATGICISTLKGHSQHVVAAVFLPDGQFAASGSQDPTVRLWDSTTESRHGTLEGHSKHVVALIFLPNSQLVASGSIENTVRLQDVTMESSRCTLKGHSALVNAVVFSPDGQLVASGLWDETVRLGDVTTGSCHSTLREGHLDWIRAVCFSQDGQLIASGSVDKTIRLWDVTMGCCRIILEGHSESVNAVCFSPDSKLVASGSRDRTVRLWNVTTGSCHSILEGHSVCVDAVVFSPDGQLVASGSDDGTVRLWDVTTGSCCSILEGHSDVIKAVCISPDGQLVASGSWDQTVRLWDVTTGFCHSKVETLHPAQAIAFSSDGSSLTTDTERISLFSPASDHSSSQEPWNLFVVDQWVESADQRLLWLPNEYRPSQRSALSVWGNRICLGHASGHITVLEFDLDIVSTFK